MQAQDIMERAQALGITLEAVGGNIIYRPKRAAPPEFVETLRENKRSLISYLGQPHSQSPNARYCRLYGGDDAGAAELKEIVRRVEGEGYVLLWSTVLEDFIAFYRSPADRTRIPAGFVPYSDTELYELFNERSADWSVEALRRIHMAKKVAGFKVMEVHDDE